MQLSDYLKSTGTPISKFAGFIGVKRQTLYRYLSGGRRPSFEKLTKIKKVTGGKVTPNDFYSERATERGAA